LRQWTGIAADDFYDAEKVALMPMGFCYPAKARAAICRHDRNARRFGMRRFWRSCRLIV